MKSYIPKVICRTLPGIILLATTFGVVPILAQAAIPKPLVQGLDASEWASIRKAYDVGRHAFSQTKDGGFVARNPGQRWRSEFDGKGFTITPDQGGWSWGLELECYGIRSAEFPPGKFPDSRVATDGGKVSFARDECLTEWFANDTRGLEQGWTFSYRPEHSEKDRELKLRLSVRGNLGARVSEGGARVEFLTDAGEVATTYAGLKAWDADGKALAVRFEENGKRALMISVDDREAHYPLTIDPVAQQAYLKASNSEYNDCFGEAVAISGDTVVVGAAYESSSATGVNGNQSSNASPASGAAYIFVRSGGVWTQQAYLKASNTQSDDFFGAAVAISGDTVVVGAGTESSNATGINGDQDNNSAFRSGAVYVFVRTGTTWSQQAYVKASNTDAGDRFGVSVGISGETMVVGALRDDSSATGVNGDDNNNSVAESGAAYVFVRNGTSWSQEAYLKASNTDAGDFFGYAVAISGDTIVVGAYQEDSPATGINGDQGNGDEEISAEDSGAAYIFVRDGLSWSQQAYLKASNTGFADKFGYSVGISGDSVVIGAYQEGSSATGVNGDQENDMMADSGAAYVFVRNDGVWSQEAYLKASNTQYSDNFGSSVAISGNAIVIGAYFEDSSSKGIDGDQSNNSADAAGAAYLFMRHGTVWSQQAYLKASNTEAYDNFGFAVAVCCGTAIIGAHYEDSGVDGVDGNQEDNSQSTAGAVYLFTVPLEDFANAMTAAGLVGEDAAFDADPDADGLANGLEWILGGNPASGSLSVSPVLGGDSVNATLTFSRLDLSECSSTIRAQWSSDLATWNDIPVGSISSAGVSVLENGASPDTIVVSVPRSNAAGGKLFLRIGAVLDSGF